MSNTPSHFVFAGGGTGGHLFPGLAVARRLRLIDGAATISFAGCGKPFERRIVEAAGFRYLAIAAHPLPRGPASAIRFLSQNLAGYRAARQFLKDNNVSVVVGLGGYASAATGRAAISLSVPLLLLEQNAVAGRATRWLAPAASVVCLAFDEARAGLPPGPRVFTTGTPTSAELSWLAAQATPPRRSRKQKQLLVLGGSGGSEQINEAVPRALYKLRHLLTSWRIVHQSGAGRDTSTRVLYGKLNLPATVTPMIANMPTVLRETDLVVSRAGGTTLAELAAAAVPAVLVPYPRAADDHQRANAEAMAAGGGCCCVESGSAVRLDDDLISAITPLLTDRQLRGEMSANIRQFARADATEAVVSLVLELAAPVQSARAA